MSRLPSAILPNTGGPLDPHDIVGRDETCRRILADFESGDQRLVDPRRLGKTSLIRRLSFVVADDRITVIEIDFQGVRTADEFFDRLVNSLSTHAQFGARFRRVARSLIEQVSVSSEFESFAITTSLSHVPKAVVLGRILDSVRAKLADDELLVLACDEVPMAIDTIARTAGPEEGRAVLQAMRALRSTRSRIRWLITGSIGFHHVVRLVGGTEGDYNDLGTVQMGPLDAADAVYLAQCLLLGVGRPADVEPARAMAVVSGGIPWIIHQIAHRMSRSAQPADAAEIHDVFDAFVRDRDASSSLTHLVTRLQPYYGNDEDLATRALDALAGATEPLDLNALHRDIRLQRKDMPSLRVVVDMLEDDHYLRTTTRGIEWRYDVIRTIWTIRRRLS